MSAVAFITIAQSTRYFEKILGAPANENTNVVFQLSNGSYITLGGSNTYVSPAFIKTDAYGNTIIDSAYIDTIYYSSWEDAKKLSDSTQIVAGWHRIGNTTTDENMWLLKMDTAGQILWSSFVGDTTRPTIADCVSKALDGGYILGGFTDELPYKACIIKTDSMGNKLWERLIAGTTWDNAITSVVILPDSSFAFGAEYNHSLSTGLVWFLRLDKNGNTIKDTTYSFDSYSSSSHEIGCIALSHDGEYILAGDVSTDTNSYTGLLIKLDSNYNTVWHKFILSAENTSIVSEIDKIIILSDGSIIGCGFSTGGGLSCCYEDLLIKFDPNGNEIWRRYFKLSSSGYNDYFYNLDTTSDGGYIMCGRTECNGCSADPFIKTNCLGFVAAPIASFTDTLGNWSNVSFYNTSQNTDTCYWNWGDGSPIQMIRLDTSAIIHDYTTSGAHTVTLIAIACGEIDSITIQTPFVTGVSNPNEKENAHVFPNPNSGILTLMCNAEFVSASLNITDILGNSVYQTKINQIKTTIDLSSLSNGIYFWEVLTDGGIEGKGKVAVMK